MASRSWKYHSCIFLVTGGAILLAGWYLGQPAWTALIALALYTAWHFVNIWRLYAWLKNPVPETPKSLGLWSDLFNQVCSMER